MYNYGVIQHELGQSILAKEAFKAVLGMDPHYTKASINLAVILQKEDRPQEAVRIAKKGLDLDPTNELAQLTYDTIIAQAFHGG